MYSSASALVMAHGLLSGFRGLPYLRMTYYNIVNIWAEAPNICVRQEPGGERCMNKERMIFVSMRFRRSIKIAPGVRLNLNKKSVGVSVGTRGARMTFNSDGRKTTSVGVPGTGVYYTKSTYKSGGSPHSDNSNSCNSSGSSQLVDFPSPELFLHQAKNIKTNRIIYSIFLPLLALMLIAVMTPVCFALAALCIIFLVLLLRRSSVRIPQLYSQAESLGRVSYDFQQIQDSETALRNTHDPVIFFLNYDRVVEFSLSAFKKSPELFDVYTPQQCEKLVKQCLSDALDDVMRHHFEVTYKKLYSLKTQKGIDDNILKFRSIYKTNRDKLNDSQASQLEAYVSKLSSVSIPV